MLRATTLLASCLAVSANLAPCDQKTWCGNCKLDYAVSLPDPSGGGTSNVGEGRFFFDTEHGRTRMDQWDSSPMNTTTIFHCPTDIGMGDGQYTCTTYNIDYVAKSCDVQKVPGMVPAFKLRGGATLVSTNATKGTETWREPGMGAFDYVLDSATCMPLRQVLWGFMGFPWVSTLQGFSDYKNLKSGGVSADDFDPKKIAGAPACTDVRGQLPVPTLSPYERLRRSA